MSRPSGIGAVHPSGRVRLIRFSITVAIGAAGGWLFTLLALPLPWMMGAMLATTLATMGGAPLFMTQKIRQPMVAVLGVMLGSAFTPAIARQMPEWIPTSIGLLGYVTVTTLVLLVYFRRIAKYDWVTAYFSASPGGFNEMVLVGRELGGDDRTIALIHATRVLLVVMIVPFGFALLEGYERTARPPLGISVVEFPLLEAFVLLAAAFVGAVGAKMLRIPAATITGPMFLSAILHLAGFSEIGPPGEIVAIAQIVIGSAIGSRFSGIGLWRITHTMLISLGATIIMLGITFGFAHALTPLTEASFQGLFLAFAPGGLAEMSLIALALGVDAAFVASHHILRIAMLVIIAPSLFRRYGLPRLRKSGALPEARPDE